MTTEPPALTKTNRIKWTRLLAFGAIFVALSLAGVLAIYGDVAEQNVMLDKRLFSWPVLAALGALLLVYFGADGLRLHFALRALGHSVSMRDLFRLVFINIFFSNITPLASGGGFAQIWYLRRRGVPLGTATTATTIRTVLAIAFIFISTPILMVTLDPLERLEVSPRLFIYLALFVSVYLMFFAIVLFRTRWLMPPLHTLLYGMRRVRLIGGRRYRSWRFGSKRETLRFAQGFRRFFSGGGINVLLSILFTCVFLLSLFSFPALLLWGLDYDVDYLTVLGLTTVTTFVMYFSPTPGASGIAEGVFGYLFAGVIGAGHLVLVTVAWRVLTIYLGMLAGILVMQHELVKSRQ